MPKQRRSSAGSSSAARDTGIDLIRAHATEAAALLRVLGNQQRLLVLCDLVEGERGVAELLAKLPLSQSALSQHLAVLREAGVVQVRREGLQAFYSLAEGPAQPLMATLHATYCEREQP